LGTGVVIGVVTHVRKDSVLGHVLRFFNKLFINKGSVDL
jgi:hypothetical protein